MATDPGWTPLFLNAGAVVLEVGGMMTHGSQCGLGASRRAVVLSPGRVPLRESDWRVVFSGTLQSCQRLSERRMSLLFLVTHKHELNRWNHTCGGSLWGGHLSPSSQVITAP